MISIPFLPPFPLGEFVHSIFCISGDMGTSVQEILPDFKTDLIFVDGAGLAGKIGDSGEHQVTVPIVNGFRRESLKFHYNGAVNLLCVRFFPYGFTRLFGVPHPELTGIRPLAEVIGHRVAGELTEKIFTEPESKKKIQLVYSWLLQVMTSADISNSLPVRAINRISFTRGAVPLQQICNNSPSEYKQLQRFCHKNLDICPKHLSRMIRFEHLHHNMKLSGRPDWISLVVNHGFTDQSHLIREVRQFTGLTPVEFFAAIDNFI